MSSQLIKKLKNKYSGKKALMVGLGLQGGGVGVAKFLAELGAKVTVTDKKTEAQLFQSINRLNGLSIEFHLGEHNIEDFLNSDFIFKGPSVPWTSGPVVQAQKKGIPIEMEMSFVVENYPGKVIGITGTRGKSTTTQLIYNLLNESGFKVTIGGGLPGISTIECLKEADENSWLVAELSSWALSGFHAKKISPHISVFTNFYPDHLNYYKNLEDYFYDKQAIFQYQKKEDIFIANESLKDLIRKAWDRKFFGGKQQTAKNLVPALFSKNDFPYKLTYLKGDHNLENAAAALKVAEILKIDKDKAVEIIKNFGGLPYRLQTVGKKGNIIFINDTTSTTPIATIKAIDSLKDKKIILFLGGNSKNLPSEQLINQLYKVEKIVLLAGSFTDEILPVLKEKYSDKLVGPFNNLEEAVKEAYKVAQALVPTKSGEIDLLFSPGATSFAMFNNEFHRGEEFNRIVEKLT
ncbi:MAG: UDP-N-acetylmuramoyl-L-alanine--D-glutamate ligase [Patescibacteria group bacterium]|jgi:UDP-N-acetylmuramoylalanine--D-glutamate ligase